MIKKIDHIVITTSDIEKCTDFYKKIGFTLKTANGRYELYAGDFKINVHILGEELFPHAENVQTGSVDLCFEIDGDIEILKHELQKKGVQIELGVVNRAGTCGEMRSIYVRDTDMNLIEFCSYKSFH